MIRKQASKTKERAIFALGQLQVKMSQAKVFLRKNSSVFCMHYVSSYLRLLLPSCTKIIFRLVAGNDFERDSRSSELSLFGWLVGWSLTAL